MLRCRLLDQRDAGLESVPVPVDEQGLRTSLLAGQDPGVISAAAETHGIMLEKAAWHWADPGTAPPALLIGYGSVREDDLARGIESLRVFS